MYGCLAIANGAGRGVAQLVDWLCGCGHPRTTFPMTLRASPGVRSAKGTQTETYIVCLDCGRHIRYDWTTMQITKRRLPWAATPALVPALRKSGRDV